MKKILLIVFIVIVGGAAYWLLSPFFITRTANEAMEELIRATTAATDAGRIESQILAKGDFKGESFHQAEGTAELVKVGEKYFIRLEKDFRVTNGPDLFIHLGKDGAYVKEARLGALKGNVGSQNYEIPSDINPLNYNEVWIWCRAFSVPFGKAVLR
ncbi:MAG: DM13 domain-containing protein [Candidatus Sungbacteria bacterium]|uniref:DM13 domain-containing protein n=1 Tax=Candidatus Sungiibacteriota bacterium TaxID=2750080 RepID=A0A931WNW4_9BACT|nr:DM13 domain-containing protein [Candidatus Sungbacteria bacterium]